MKIIAIINITIIIINITRICAAAIIGGSMVSGALGKISRLCPPLNDGPSDDGFQLTLSVSKFTYLINE